MRESEKTFNRGKQIARIYPQGIEAKEIWFGGDLIFKAADFVPSIKEITIDGQYTDLIRIGTFVVAYSKEAPGTIAKIKGGRVTYETITSNSVKAFGIPKHELLIMIDMVDDKFYFIRSDGVTEYAITSNLRPYLARLNVLTNKLFIVNNILYLGAFFEDKQGFENHLYNTIAFLILDPNLNPYDEVVYSQYGINPASDIQPDTEYAVVEKVAIDIEYDEASDKVFLVYPTKLYNGNLTIRYIRADNFNGLTFTESTLISSGERGIQSVVNLTAPSAIRQKIGAYAKGGIDEYRPNYSFGYLISNYEAYLLARAMGGTARYQFEIQMRGAACGFYSGQYWTISDDIQEDVWHDPPLILNHGIWASDEPRTEDFMKVADTMEDWSSDEFLFGTNNADGLYFIYGLSSFNTIIRYMS